MQQPEMMMRGTDRASDECEQIRALLDEAAADPVARGQFWAGYVTFVAGFAAADIGPDLMALLLDAVNAGIANLPKQQL